MKKTLSLIIASVFVVSTFILAGCGEDYPAKLSVYSFKTAVIQYELSGGTTGDQSVFVRGDQKAVHRFITTPGQEATTFDLFLGEERYFADLEKMTAVKTVDSGYNAMLAMTPDEQKAYMIKKNLGLKESANMPESLGTTMVAGQECELYSIENIGTACVWNTIVLQSEITLAGITNKVTAVKVEVDTDIPSERFELPAGVIVTSN